MIRIYSYSSSINAIIATFILIRALLPIVTIRKHLSPDLLPQRSLNKVFAKTLPSLGFILINQIIGE